MTPEEKKEERFAVLLSAKGVRFQSPEAEASFKANVKRLKDVIQLKKPDRVPVLILGTFVQAQLYGVTPFECMYQYEKLIDAHRKFLQDYKPDLFSSPAFAGCGNIFDTLGYKQYRWPGRGISENSTYQYVEGEYMGAEEYPALIDDPTDFWLRTYFPRIFGALESLTNLNPFPNLWEIVGVSGWMTPFGNSSVQNALKALMKAGNEATAWNQHIVDFRKEAKGLGFLIASGGATKAPFDILADTLRGTRAIMVDMYRRPDMVLKAVESLTPLYVKQGVGAAASAENPIVFIPLHKGADGFMSDEQFKRFYWPTLKALVLGLVSEGCVPFLFCEGSYNSRLEYLKELPEGSCLCVFDRTDMARAKELIGKRICIGGNVPSGMILTGTPGQVKAYCKHLIDVAGEGGGYIMSFGTSMDEGRPDTIHAMIDFTKEYGVYK